RERGGGQGGRLAEEGQRRRLLAGVFALMRPAGTIEYTLRTAAGRLGFDNASARAIVAALAAGPRRLGDIAEQGSMAAEDIVANAVVLGASHQIRAGEATAAPGGAVNAAMVPPPGGPAEVRWLALPCGTAIIIDDALEQVLGGAPGDSAERGDWRTFLAAHGV